MVTIELEYLKENQVMFYIRTVLVNSRIESYRLTSGTDL